MKHAFLHLGSLLRFLLDRFQKFLKFVTLQSPVLKEIIPHGFFRGAKTEGLKQTVL